MNPSEPKRASAQCFYCARNVSDCVRIRCAECPDELDLCVECFSVGAEVGPHKACHSYRVVDSLAFPFLTFDWSAEEELALLEALETYGLSSWTDVADHVGTKTKTQCHAHYCERYINAPTAPLPDLSAVIGKEGASALAVAQDAAAAAASAAAAPPPAAADGAPSSLTAGPSAPPLSAGAAAALALASTGIAEEMARQALLASFSRPADPRLEGNSAELTGFNAKRGEFDPEYDNEAELPLADMDFRKEDTAEERALKLRMVEVYNMRLDERARRRAFILDRGLLNVKRVQAVERRRTPEERELAARCRVLAHFHTPAEHEALLDGLATEARLRARTEELKEWRRAGITSLTEGDVYEAEKRRRATERARIRALEGAAAAAASAAAAAAAAGKLPNARLNRYLSRDPVSTAAPAVPPGGALRELQKLHASDGVKAAAAAAAAGVPAGGRRPKGTYLDLLGLPGAELLTSRERELCASCRLVPVHYLAVKEALIRASPLRRADARTMFRLDAHRVGSIYDLLASCGLVKED